MAQTQLAFNQIVGFPINVKDKGAVGDGVTDDTVAIQAALDAGNVIFFPDGTYKVTSTLTRTAGSLELFGNGKEQVTLKYEETDGTSLFQIANGVSTISNIHIHDIGFSGGDTATGACLEISDTSTCIIERVSIQDFSQNTSTSRGLWFKGREFIRVSDVFIKDCVTCIYFDENPNASSLDADHVIVERFNMTPSDTDNGIGIDMSATDHTTFKVQDGSIGVAKYGIRIDNSTSSDSINLNIKNVRIEQGGANQPTEVASHARGVLTLTGNAANGETVTLGSKTYTFQTTLTNVDGNVQIGASASDSIDNLIAAIVLGAGSGTKYAAATTAQPESITAVSGVGDTMNVGNGTDGTQATTETLSNGSWNSSTLRTQANTGYAIYLNQSSGSAFQSVVLESIICSTYMNGFYLRNINRCIMDNCQLVGGYAHECLNLDATVLGLVARNLRRDSTAQDTTTGLAALKLEDANGGLEQWGPTANPPALSGTSYVKTQLPFLFAGGTTSADPAVGQMLNHCASQVVADTNVITPIPASVQGFGIVQAADTTGGNRESAIFTFDDTVQDNDANLDLLANTANVTKVASTATSLNIYGSANQLRIQNNLGASTVVSYSIWYTDSALS